MSLIQNPALNADAFAGTWAARGLRTDVMTVTGTAIKAFGLLAILMASAGWSWYQTGAGTMNNALLMGSFVGSLIVFFITMFKREWSPVTAPIYAAFEGVLLGSISYMIEHNYGARYGVSGIAYQAVAYTSGTLFLMLFLYSTRIIRVTGKLVGGIVAATGAIALVYVGSMILSLFGVQIPYIYGSGPIGIAFSLFVVGLAAFNLLLDFDIIEQGAAMQAPKWMEWYAAFGLMVTLVWLYLEILKLLAKLSRRSSD